MTPHLVKWHEKYGPAGLTIIEIDNGRMDSLSAVQREVAKERIPFAVLHDKNGAACTLYGVHGYPTAYLINADGRVIWEGHPVGTTAAIERVISKSLPASRAVSAELR